MVTTQPNSDRLAPCPAVPRDVKTAVEFMRTAICRPISMADLARHCGVPERTLSRHFRTFFDISPMRYLRQLRLAAAREVLLSGEPGISVTEVAERFEFNHFGRFAGQYRRSFGETPSTTLRHGRASADSKKEAVRNCGAKARKGSDPIGLPPPHSRDHPSIAILPCRVPANEPALHWVSESIADAIAMALGSIHSLAVIVPRSLRAANGDAQHFARELNARYVLTGRIMSVSSRLRVILFVLDSATGQHVWGDAFDGEPDEYLELQDRAVAGILRTIPPSIRGAEIDRARRAPPRHLDAYGLAMRALRFVFASQPEATLDALELLHRAIEIDPDYGLAHALAAWCHGQLVMYNGTGSPAEEKSRAIELARRAAILDDSDPLVLASRSAVHTMAGEFDVAGALVARAIALDPSFGWAWGRSGWLHSYRGESETAIEHFRRALSLDPDRASRANNLVGIGSAHFNAGRYDSAAFWLRKALLEKPGMWWANRSLSVSYLRSGDRLKALHSLDTLRRFCPDLTVGQVMTAVPFGPDFLDRLGEGLNDLGLPP